MHERIENCLYQAGLTADGCWNTLDTYTKDGIEKFAELIIKECSEIALSKRLADSSTQIKNLRDLYDVGCDDTAHAISGMILTLLHTGNP
jgi:hypothetical protein